MLCSPICTIHRRMGSDVLNSVGSLPDKRPPCRETCQTPLPPATHDIHLLLGSALPEHADGRGIEHGGGRNERSRVARLGGKARAQAVIDARGIGGGQKLPGLCCRWREWRQECRLYARPHFVIGLAGFVMSPITRPATGFAAIRTLLRRPARSEAGTVGAASS